MKIVKLIVCILFGAMFVFGGSNKLFHYMPPPKLTPEQMEVFGAMAKLTWLMPLLGVTETVGGILFAIPRTRALGAIFVFPIMVGIFLHHAVMEPTGLPMAAALMLINIWMIVDNRQKYLPMVSK